MAKFCAECGNKLNDSVRFCGSCGTAVLTLCPTCGQEWNQIPAAAPAPAEKKPAATKAAAPVSTAQGSFAETSARVQPIYGPSFDAAKDCPNCGAKGMGKKTCTTCESEN
ncbi:unannotated protein [freshwater metagenome]|uniref:Unannotated protein n=1 Tax=freshwater metagenome TaxID=449393 RepID=A0A6J6FPE0_9ZZZZ|nr:zinc-ribbon domain-containing protein [Actinomycetota bacterium]